MKGQIFTLTPTLPWRYSARVIIILCSLIINSWAIAALVPSHQVNTHKTNNHQTQLTVSDLALSFVSPTLPERANRQAAVQKHNETAPHKKPIKKITKTLTAKPLIQQTEPLEIQNTPKDLDEPDTNEIPTKDITNALTNKEAKAPTNPLITKPLFAAPPKQPRYPSLARKRGQEGTVWFEIWLSDLGEQTSLVITESSGITSLDHAALKAITSWQFLPYQFEGIAIASRVRIPVEFVLN